MILKNKNGQLIINDKELILKNNNNETLTLSGENDFILLVNDKSFYSKDALKEIQTNNEAKITLKYSFKDFYVLVNYLSENNKFVKNIEIFSKNEIFIKQICLESKASDIDLSVGFEGMPCFASNIAWLGIEFPSCNNQYKNNICNFLQTPYYKGCYFKSFDVVYVLNNNKNIEEEFKEYVKSFALNKENIPYRVFCNWGLYDNLTPNDPIIDEKLAIKNLNDLKKFIIGSKVRFDYYIMDAFWHKEGNKYQEYDKDIFPNGISNVLNKVKQLKMNFGLWFDINFIHNKPKDFKQYDNLLNNNSYCFACDEVALAMSDAILKHIKEDNLKIIKLDFAYFECQNPNHNHSINHIESKEKSIKNFIEMVNKIHKLDKDVKILCYNGWTINLDCLASVKKDTKKVVSPYWLKYVNYIYCGDPRPSEIPTQNFATSLIYYSDAMLRNFSESYIPLYAIDDHGSMMGSTGTIYRIKKAAFRQSILHNVLRGTNKINPYGDISLLDKDDMEYYHFIDNILTNINAKKMKCEFILGDVRNNEVYGYRIFNDKEGYILIVNPNYLSQNVNVNLNDFNNKNINLELLIKNGILVNDKINTFNNFIINMNENDYLLYKYEIVECKNNYLTYNNSKEIVKKENYKEVKLKNEDLLTLNTNNNNHLIICFKDINNNPLRTLKGYPEGFKIVDENGNTLKDNLPCEAIWSGVSWLYLNTKNIKEVKISYKGEPIVINYRFDK